ncbi:hypothetical protein BDZ94DRAFT_1055303 [Collybia nuda]|uniref:Uncharacterized protein n=1 Tax=Collybia nuda TaxID=64659 RepID=A0A9P5XYR8_9AGAR|nr:hypothetical protein BDZ94DRAFT_1055303 [Collybia nuda]
MKYPYKVHEKVSLGYEFPSTFQIGSKHTGGSLVSTKQLRGHLALLRAFAQLREQVDKLHERPGAILSRIPKGIGKRWAWFSGLAVERFTAWCLAISLDDICEKLVEDMLPPLDVMMVWHTYMLNPGWYTEDLQRLPSLGVLQEAGKKFSELLPELIDILASKASTTRVEAWTLKTGRVFDPLEDAIAQEYKIVLCPICRDSIQAPLMTNDGQGYLQDNFVIRCPQPSCVNQAIISRAVLAARKLAEDLVRDDGTMRTYLAGTLHSSDSELDTDHVKGIKDRILSILGFARPQGSTEEQWIVSILKESMYFLQKVKWDTFPPDDNRLISRVSSAYVDDRMFSVELTGAVTRQGLFVKKINDIWWAQFSEKEESTIALQHAVARYHAFLNLMALSPTAFFVPTLDIDLVWHTHQLLASKYNRDCMEYVGRFVDHEDKVDPNSLVSSFDDTCRAWKNIYGIQYGYCGCILPGETLKDKLSHFLGNHTETPAHLIPIEREDILDATHGSDHNAVYPVGGGPTGVANRKFDKRLKHHEKLRRRGKLDVYLAERSRGHNQAFLVPVWMYAQQGPVVTGCVARGGSDIKPTLVGRRAVVSSVVITLNFVNY